MPCTTSPKRYPTLIYNAKKVTISKKFSQVSQIWPSKKFDPNSFQSIKKLREKNLNLMGSY
mgnify:CR=1 FL=1